MNRVLTVLILFVITSCSKNDSPDNCNFLSDNALVNISINLNLPQYSQLQYTSNSVYIANQGVGGVIVTNVGNDYRAWDAADPNHAPTSCSRLTIDGANAICGCTDANEYSLFIGQAINATLPCGLKEYRTQVSGNTITIFN